MSKQKNIPTVFVIFGATGDLMARKITPALFHLFIKGKLPKMLRIIGVSRRPITDEEFRQNIREILSSEEGKHDKDSLERFIKTFSYQSGDFERQEVYDRLAKELGRVDDEWKVCSNKLFYLAVPPNYYEKIFENLHASGLTIPCSPEEGWTRVIVEKPFGSDLAAAQRLDLLLGKLFEEEQIYRIDHYVGKEMLQNILSFRFSNTLLEESWNNKFIEKIEIRLYEKGGVSPRRGSFYDGIGALRDVGQNHLLQMLAFVTMDNPGTLDTEAIRAKKAKILAALDKFSLDEIKKRTYRSQYEGYRQLTGVKPDSTTETYFKIKTYLDNPRWQGVPIYLEAGKGIPQDTKEIVVTFKHPSPCFCPPGAAHLNNKVVFSIEPKTHIDIHFLAKRPGLTMAIEERTFNFAYRRVEDEETQEYERLLLDCIEGNQVLFISTSEIKAEWEFIDPVLRAWEQDKVPLVIYKPGSYEVVEKANQILDDEGSSQGIKKEIGVVGLGKMGRGIALQLLEKGWKVVGFNRTASVAQSLRGEGLETAATIEELVKKLDKPRVIWVMLPAGSVTEEVVFGAQTGLINYLETGDIVVDAGNSFYQDAARRGATFKERGSEFIDVGVSGGPAGARYGACLMIGGDKTTYEKLIPLFIDISVPQGFQFFEGLGAGHFVKMIHNGIEYGMMQAIAEGFSLLEKAQYKLNLDKVAHVYNHGSVIESRLMAWLESAFSMYGDSLDEVSGTVAHTGEGAWTVEAAKLLGLKTKVIEAALEFRLESEKNPSYSGKILSALRNQFGGHDITVKNVK